MKGQIKRIIWAIVLFTLTISSNSTGIIYALEQTNTTTVCYQNKEYSLPNDKVEEFISLWWQLGSCSEELDTLTTEENTSTWTTEKENKNWKKKEKQEKINTWSLNNTRIEICHKTWNGWQHTIKVNSNSLSSHLAHWDTEWPCTEEIKPNESQNQGDGCVFVDKYWNTRDIYHSSLLQGKVDKLFKKCWEDYKITPHAHCERVFEIFNSKKVSTRLKVEKRNLEKELQNLEEKIKKFQKKLDQPKRQKTEKRLEQISNKIEELKGQIETRKKNNKYKIIDRNLLFEYNNCLATNTPFSIPTDEELASDWVLTINWDSRISEALSLELSITPQNIEGIEMMAFSEDGVNFSEFESFSIQRDYLLQDQNQGTKTVYTKFQLKDWTTSKVYKDSILLLPRYWANFQLISDWLEKNQSYQAGKSYLFKIKAYNTGFEEWKATWDYPTNLIYTIKDSNWNIISEINNYWVLNQDIAYGGNEEISILTRLPEDYQGQATISFNLQHFGNTTFEEAGVKSLEKTIEIKVSEETKRITLTWKESLPFGIGDLWENYYSSLDQEPLPSDIVSCSSNWTPLYKLTSSGSVFEKAYFMAYSQNISEPRIKNLWVNSSDLLSFYEVLYDNRVDFTDSLYAYNESIEKWKVCSANILEYEKRSCQWEFSDVTLSDGVDNYQCWTIYTVSAKDFFSGYKDWSFRPEWTMNLWEFSKTLVNASELPLTPYRGEISDLDWTEWYASYLQTLLDNNVLQTSSTWAIFAERNITLQDAVKWSLEAFWLDVNGCDYSVINSENPYLSASLYYWLIGKTDIKSDYETAPTTRLSVATILMNSYNQKENFKSATQNCPLSKEDKFQTETKQICWTQEQVVLSSTSNLEKDLAKLENWTEVQILDDSSSKVKVRYNQTEWYLLNSELTDYCKVATPWNEVKTPEGNQVVVASKVWIYAHVKPNATSEIFDYNKDGQWNTQDVIPYNTVLEVIATQGNWFQVKIWDDTPWIFNWFLAIWEDVEIDAPVAIETGTISWAHNLTVDLRTNTDKTSLENILWETYENTKVHIIEKDELNNLSLVKIVSTEQNISEETFSKNYARLYPNVSATDLQSLQKWVAGWVHSELVKEDGVDYSVSQTLDYPFDYEGLSASGKTVDMLVTQIFFEEFSGEVHEAMDFNLEAGTEVKAVASWRVSSVDSDTVTVLHDDWRESVYHHIVPNSNILNWTIKTVTAWMVVWVVAEDTTEFKSHLHFELRGLGENLNPSKYFKVYNADDSHKCVRELIVWSGVYDGEEIKEKCDVGVWFNRCSKFVNIWENGVAVTIKEDAWICKYLNEWFRTWMLQTKFFDKTGDWKYIFNGWDTATRAENLRLYMRSIKAYPSKSDYIINIKDISRDATVRFRGYDDDLNSYKKLKNPHILEGRTFEASYVTADKKKVVFRFDQAWKEYWGRLYLSEKWITWNHDCFDDLIPAKLNGTFGDITYPDDWKVWYACKAVRSDKLTKNDEFRPDDSISKAEVLWMLYKVYWLKDSIKDTSCSMDVLSDELHDIVNTKQKWRWAVKYIAQAVTTWVVNFSNSWLTDLDNPTAEKNWYLDTMNRSMALKIAVKAWLMWKGELADNKCLDISKTDCWTSRKDGTIEIGYFWEWEWLSVKNRWYIIQDENYTKFELDNSIEKNFFENYINKDSSFATCSAENEYINLIRIFRDDLYKSWMSESNTIIKDIYTFCWKYKAIEYRDYEILTGWSHYKYYVSLYNPETEKIYTFEKDGWLYDSGYLSDCQKFEEYGMPLWEYKTIDWWEYVVFLEKWVYINIDHRTSWWDQVRWLYKYSELWWLEKEITEYAEKTFVSWWRVIELVNALKIIKYVKIWMEEWRYKHLVELYDEFEDNNITCATIETVEWIYDTVCHINGLKDNYGKEKWAFSIRNLVLDENHDIPSEYLVKWRNEENTLLDPTFCKKIWNWARSIAKWDSRNGMLLSALACYNEAIQSFEREARYINQEENKKDWSTWREVWLSASILSITHASYQMSRWIYYMWRAIWTWKAISWLKTLWNWIKVLSPSTGVWMLVAAWLEVALETWSQRWQCKDYDFLTCEEFIWLADNWFWPDFVEPVFQKNVLSKWQTIEDTVILIWISVAELDTAITAVRKLWGKMKTASKTMNTIDSVSDLDSKTAGYLDDIKDIEAWVYKGSTQRRKEIEKAFLKEFTDSKGKRTFISWLETDDIIRFKKFANSLEAGDKLEFINLINQFTAKERDILVKFLKKGNITDNWNILKSKTYNKPNDLAKAYLEKLKKYDEANWTNEYGKAQKFYDNQKRMAHADMIVNDLRDTNWNLLISKSLYNPEWHHLIPQSFFNSSDENIQKLVNDLSEAFDCPNVIKSNYCLDGVFNVNIWENAFVLPKGFHYNNTVKWEEAYNNQVFIKIRDAIQRWWDDILEQQAEVLSELENIRTKIANMELKINTAQREFLKDYVVESLVLYKWVTQ